LYEGHVNALTVIQTFGTPDQARRFAHDAGAGHRLFAVWNTEGAAGVRLTLLGGDRFRLEGAKTFASGAGHVTRPLLTAALPDGGWQMVVPAMEHASATIDESSWRPLGMHASASYTIDLTGIEIGRDALIGGPGDYYQQPWFSGGALRFAAAQLGGAIALLDAARAELVSLGRTEDPFQRSRMGEAAIAIQGGLLWLRAAAARADRSSLGGAGADDVPPAQMAAFANMVRTTIERICLDVLEIAERSIGARALLKPHPIERIGRDLTLYLRQPAPDATQTQVGQHVLGSSRSALDLWTLDWAAGPESG
ncbi:MAG: acyl-CoA dehydrogenase, partial [Chloroflexia bacterium]|nr:acyl-CoA dehydrogenase [Chloroflexia bacterium]